MKKHTAQSLKILTCSVMVAALVMPYENGHVKAAEDSIIYYENITNVNLSRVFNEDYTFNSTASSFYDIRYDKNTKRLSFKVDGGNGDFGYITPSNKVIGTYGQFGFQLFYNHVTHIGRNEYYDSYHNKSVQKVSFFTDASDVMFNGNEISMYTGNEPTNFNIRGYLTADFGSVYLESMDLLNVPLKLKNEKPSLQLTSSNQQIVSEMNGYNNLLISGNVKDSDIGDELILRYSVDGTSLNNVNFSSLVANGSEQSFSHNLTIDPSIPEGNRTLRVWAEDNKGGKSNEVTHNFNVDKSGPNISVSNITENQVIVNAVTPAITITDANSYSKEILLNGMPYTQGTEINTSGQQTLKINTVDAVGNAAAKTVNFTINKTPIIANPIASQVANKFDVLTLDLKEVFSDAENDTLTFEAVSDNTDVATATINNNLLEIKALKNGATTNITVTANDGFSKSDSHRFSVLVHQRIPTITLIEPKHLFVDDTNTVSIKGTVKDGDLEKVSVKAKINEVTKQVFIDPTTGGEDSWHLTWNGTELASGVYENIVVRAEDSRLGKSSTEYPKAIIKVPTTVEEYEAYLEQYSQDLEKDVQDFTNQEHNDLLSAYTASLEALADLTDENIQKAIEALNKLENGNLKDQMLDQIKEKIIEDILSDFDLITEEKLKHAGFKDVVAENLAEYIKNLNQYQQDKGSNLISKEIQQVINVTNDVVTAEKQPAPTTLDKTLETIGELTYEAPNGLKEQLHAKILDAAVKYVNDHKETIEITDLERIGIKEIDATLLDQYRTNLKNHVAVADPAEVQKVIDVTKQLDHAIKNAEDGDIATLKSLESALNSSPFKTDLEKVNQVLENLQAAEKDWSTNIATMESAVTAIQEPTLKAKLELIKEVATNIQAAFTELTVEKIDEAIFSINKLQDGKLKNRLLEKVGDIHFDYVISNLPTIEVDDLIRAGMQNIDKSNIKDYRDYLQELADELDQPLTRDQVQLIIDIINAINKCKETKDLVDVQAAIDLVKQLPKGKLKDKLLADLNKLKDELTPKNEVSGSGGGNSGSYPYIPVDHVKEPIKKGETVVIEGKPIENATEFTIDESIINELMKENNQDLRLVQGKEVEIVVPKGTIDFEALLKELGKYGLTVQLIKIDDQNYQLKVVAVSAEGKKELVSFSKHLSVLVKGQQEKGSAVLRKDGERLVPVPHTFVDGAFTVKTIRTGQFIVVNNEKSFEDIEGLYSEKQILDLANREIVNGTAANTFTPNSKITRAELAVMIARALDLQPAQATTFTDVKGKWYESAVQANYEVGIITGTTNETFSPNEFVTREQGAVMMARALKYVDENVQLTKIYPYEDGAKISKYSAEDVFLLRELNIMTGSENNKFNPKDYLTRAQMAKVLHGTLKHIEFM